MGLPTGMVVGFCVAFALPFAYLWAHPFSGGDYFHNTWVYANNIRNLAAGASFLSANINYPVQKIGLLHELQPLNTLLFLPFYLAGKPLQGYFFVVYVAMVLTALAVYWIVVQLGGRPMLAWCAAVFASCAGYRLDHLMHAQLLALQWLLLPYGLLIAYFTSGRRGFLIGYVALLVALLAGPSYSGVEAALLLTSLALLLLLNPGASRPFLRAFVVASAVAVMITVPINLAYAQALKLGAVRHRGEIQTLAPDLIQLLAPPSSTSVYASLSSRLDHFAVFPTSWIFPGYLVLAFISAGLVIAVLRMVGPTRRPLSPFLIALVLTGLLFVVLSCGPQFKWAGVPVARNPLFDLFYDVVPLLKATRFVPQHGFVGLVLLMIAAAVLVGDSLTARFRFHQRHALALTLTALATCVILAENLRSENLVSQIKSLARRNDTMRMRVYEAVARATPATLLSLPAGGADEYDYMYYSLLHRNNIFNGQTGVTPLVQRFGRRDLAGFPDQRSWDFIRMAGIRYLVIHKRSMTPPMKDCSAVPNEGFAKLAYQDEDACAIELTDAAAPSIGDYRLGTVIRFGEQGTYWRYLPGLVSAPVADPQVAGWSSGTADATWTSGHEASLALTIRDGNFESSDATLVAHLQSVLLTPAQPVIRVHVFGNDVHLADWELRSDADIRRREAIVPRTLLASGAQPLRLRLQIDGVRSPLALGISADPRELGLLLNSLTIEKGHHAQ